MMTSRDAIVAAVWQAVHTHGHDVLELEFRLGKHLPGNSFSSSVGKEAFEAVSKKLDASTAWTATYEINTVDMIHTGGAKHITTTAHSLPGPLPPPQWLTKTRIATIDIPTHTALSARASVSIETFAPADADVPPTTSRRIKSRKRYVWNCWAFDLTRVHSTLPDDLDNDDVSYEIEIELVDPGMLFERTMDSLVDWGLVLVQDVLDML